jgi:CheY-like chemotaxis protein
MDKARVLVVEDEKILAMGLKKKLEEMGHTVLETVNTGEKAIKSAKEHNPDIILMDIVLKGNMDGIDATKIIRRQMGIPVIYLTAYADEEVIKRARATEPYGYIVKPYRSGELNANIQMALYKHRLSKKESEKTKKVILEDFYSFIDKTRATSNIKNESETRKLLFEVFAERLEANWKHNFKINMKKNGINESSLGGEIFETYLIWLMNQLNNIGIKNSFKDNSRQLCLKFENCPWIEESPKNPIFCLNCKAILIRSFEWTSLEGEIINKHTIANGSSECVFSFNF